MYKSVIPVNGEGGEFRHVDYAYNPHLSTGDNSSLSLYNHQAGLAESRFNTQPLPPTRRMVDEPSREIYAQTIAPLRESIDNRPVDPRGVTVIYTGGSTLSHHHHGNNSKVHSSTVFIPADSREESRVDEKELARRFKKKFGNGENRLMRHDSAERVDSPCDCVTLSVLACLCMCPIGIISLYCAGVYDL